MSSDRDRTPMPSSFDGDKFFEESPWQRISRRIREEPLIPLGMLLTCVALYQARNSIRDGDKVRTNRMFRYRIYGQAFTLVAMLAGAKYWETDRAKRKEFDAAVAEKKVNEKNAAWLKELEARDEEEKEIQALKEKRAAALSKGKQKEKKGVEEQKEEGDEEKPKKARVLEAVAALGKK